MSETCKTKWWGLAGGHQWIGVSVGNWHTSWQFKYCIKCGLFLKEKLTLDMLPLTEEISVDEFYDYLRMIGVTSDMISQADKNLPIKKLLDVLPKPSYEEATAK